MDGSDWGSAVAEGSTSSNSTVITFPPKQGRFLRITQTTEVTTEGEPSWAMLRLRLFERGTAR